MDSCFALFGARQHSVTKICNASQEPTHINCKMTGLLNQVPYFELTCAPKHALPHHVFRSARKPKCHDWCLEKQKINVAGQSQPKHLNIQTHGQYHVLTSTMHVMHVMHVFFLADQIPCRSYVGGVYRMHPLQFIVTHFYWNRKVRW